MNGTEPPSQASAQGTPTGGSGRQRHQGDFPHLRAWPHSATSLPGQPSASRCARTCRELFDSAGITLNGSRPWDIQVSNPAFYQAVLMESSLLPLGESYMDGWWEAEALDETIYRILSSGLPARIRGNLRLLLNVLAARLFNFQSPARSFLIAEKHYNLGNDLFRAMLDPRMVYTCAYFEGTDSLAEAQEKKLELVCRKLGLEPGQRVLDIGCGWGSFARYAAETRQVSVVGITVSEEQVALASERCRNMPITIRLQDYRELNESFDHIVSLGMFEHVGVKNYRTYMEVVDRCLRPGGRFLLQTIGSNQTTCCIDPWINKYIFPNSMLPSLAQIGQVIEGVFVLDDLHSFGPHYDRTLMAWYENFERHWPRLQANYGGAFFRMWRFYLLACAGIFRSRTAQLWQILLSSEKSPAGTSCLRNVAGDSDHLLHELAARSRG